MPEGGSLPFQVFCELSRCRVPGLVAAVPIGYVDLDAYQRVVGLRLTAGEVETILALDRLYRELMKS